jgi:hypothetical protein
MPLSPEGQGSDTCQEGRCRERSERPLRSALLRPYTYNTANEYAFWPEPHLNSASDSGVAATGIPDPQVCIVGGGTVSIETPSLN